MRRWALGVLWLIVGCDDHVVGQGGGGLATCESPDTWETFGAGYVRTWCMSCHSSALSPELRYGAPVWANFDTLADVRSQLETMTGSGNPGIEARATGADPDMPPAGGIAAESQERFDAWIACGAPGVGTVVVAACAGPEIAGDRVVDGAAAATALCGEGTSVAGNLTVSGSAALPCLCAVGGDVVVTGAATDVALPVLSTVGGSIRADAQGLVSLALSAPLTGLHTVGGNVELVGLPSLTTVLLGELEEVVGDVVVTDVAALVTLDTPRLTTVGGDVLLARATSLATFDLPMLETVGGDLTVAENPALVNLADAYDLRSVGGSLILRDNDLWFGMVLASFGKLATIGGDLVVERNASLTRVAGFTELLSVGGSVRLLDNDDATALDGFDNLATVGGDLEVAGNARLADEQAFNLLDQVTGTLRVADNPLLASLQGLSYATTVGGLHFEGLAVMPNLQGFANLVLVDGDLTIRTLGNAMKDISGFDALQTVAGDLEIAENVGLAGMTGFTTLATVGGDLTIVDNPALPASEAQDLADGITTIVGAVTISGNDG